MELKICRTSQNDVNGKAGSHKLLYKDNDTLISIHSLLKISKYSGKDGAEPKSNKLGLGNGKKPKPRLKTGLRKSLMTLFSFMQSEKHKKDLPMLQIASCNTN